MTALTNGLYPPSLDDLERKRLVEVAKDWSIANGLAVRPPPTVVLAETDPHVILATGVPVTLFPSPFPQVCFEQARDVQKTYNELYARISQDEEFITGIVEEYVPFNMKQRWGT
jgi:glutathione synthase